MNRIQKFKKEMPSDQCKHKMKKKKKFLVYEENPKIKIIPSKKKREILVEKLKHEVKEIQIINS